MDSRDSAAIKATKNPAEAGPCVSTGPELRICLATTQPKPQSATGRMPDGQGQGMMLRRENQASHALTPQKGVDVSMF